MKFQPHFLRIATLPIASVLLIIAVAALRPVYATSLKAESDAERYVLEQLRKGGGANLEALSEDKRELSATFIANLLTNRDMGSRIPRRNSANSRVRPGWRCALLSGNNPAASSSSIARRDATRSASRRVAQSALSKQCPI